jgi:hypothetical protein
MIAPISCVGDQWAVRVRLDVEAAPLFLYFVSWPDAFDAYLMQFGIDHEKFRQMPESCEFEKMVYGTALWAQPHDWLEVLHGPIC